MGNVIFDDGDCDADHDDDYDDDFVMVGICRKAMIMRMKKKKMMMMMHASIVYSLVQQQLTFYGQSSKLHLKMKSVVTCTVFFNGIVSAFKAEEPCMENPARLCVVLVAKNSGNPTFEGRILLAMKWVLCFALLIIFTVKSNKT